LVDYPSGFVPPTVAVGATLCWLSLGSSSVQRTRSHLTNTGGQDMKTVYEGIGVSVVPSSVGAYFEINVCAPCSIALLLPLSRNHAVDCIIFL
jgi:hypothetical protein